MCFALRKRLFELILMMYTSKKIGKEEDLIMNTQKILAPLFKTIDKVIFGFEETDELDNQPTYAESENDEEFDVVRSSN